jgi:hypothetical protein
MGFNGSFRLGFQRKFSLVVKTSENPEPENEGNFKKFPKIPNSDKKIIIFGLILVFGRFTLKPKNFR